MPKIRFEDKKKLKLVNRNIKNNRKIRITIMTRFNGDHFLHQFFVYQFFHTNFFFKNWYKNYGKS